MFNEISISAKCYGCKADLTPVNTGNKSVKRDGVTRFNTCIDCEWRDANPKV